MRRFILLFALALLSFSSSSVAQYTIGADKFWMWFHQDPRNYGTLQNGQFFTNATRDTVFLHTGDSNAVWFPIPTGSSGGGSYITQVIDSTHRDITFIKSNDTVFVINVNHADTADFAPRSDTANYSNHSGVTDSLHNIRQEVWQRTAGGEASLVNLGDSVIIGNRSISGNSTMRGKVTIRGNTSQPDVIFLSDSGNNDHLYMRGRMNTNGYWEMRNYSASNRFAITTGQVNSASNYTQLNLGGTGQGNVGIQVVPVNALDVAGGVSIGTGTPSSVGSGSLYVNTKFSGGYANAPAASNPSPENIALGVSNDADGIIISDAYSHLADQAREVYRKLGVLTTTDATLTQLMAYSMANSQDSTGCQEWECHIVAYHLGGGTPANRGHASYTLMGTFGFINGAVTQIGSTTVVHSAESNASLACALNANGVNVKLEVTGIAGESWRWYGYTVRRYAGHLTQ